MNTFTRIRQKGIKRSIRSAYSIGRDKYFDFRYNIDTYSWVPVSSLDVVDHKKEHAVLYQATRVLPLRQLFRTLKISNNKIIIDIGCGKGRVLLVASEYGFKEVRGVEFSKLLCSIAQKNITKFKTKRQTNTNFVINHADASKFRFKDDEDIFFLYNPFDAYIMKSVLKHISNSLKRRPRKVQLIYANPVHKNLIEFYVNITKEQNFNIWEFEFVVYEVE